MFQRFLTLLLTALMMLSTVPLASAEASATASDPTNVYGGLAPLPDADDPITFTIFVRDPGMDPAADNPVLQKITELTGVTINFEFLVGDLDQKLGVMIAGEDYPDAIFAGDASMKLMDAGAFIPLEELIPQYPNLNAMYGGCLDAMAFSDGHVYGMEMYNTWRGNTVVNPGPVYDGYIGFWLQKAVIEEAGYQIPHTVDEYFTMIETYMSKYPEIDGVKTTGSEILCEGWRNWALINPVQNLQGEANSGSLMIDYDTLESKYYHNTDAAYDYYKKLNVAYHKGLINAETFTQSYDQYIAKLTTGAVLGFFDQNWNFGGAVDLLKADGKFNRTWMLVPIANEGVTDGYIEAPNPNGVLPSGLNGIGITTKCKNPERLLKFYDWLLQRDVQDYLNWGEEGKDWTSDTDGGKIFTAERRALWLDSARKRDETGFTLWNYSPAWQGVYKIDGEPARKDDFASEYLASQSAYDQAFFNGLNIKYPAEVHSESYARPDCYPVWSMALEDGSAAAIANTKLTDVTTKYFPRLILAEDDAAYDKLWEDFIKEFNAIDLDSLKKEIDRQIKQRMGL